MRRGYGGHGGTSVAPANRWLFAEGSQGFFSTYVLLANDNNVSSDVNITFLVEGGASGGARHDACPRSRASPIDAGTIPELVDRSFGIDVSSAQPIIAERAMYLPGRASVRRRPRIRRRQQREPELVPGGRRDRGVLRLLRADEQSEQRGGERLAALSAAGWRRPFRSRSSCRPTAARPSMSKRWRLSS